MRKVYHVIAAFLLILNQSNAQVTYTWVGGAPGNITVATNGFDGAPPGTIPAITGTPALNVTREIVVYNAPSQISGAVSPLPETSEVSLTIKISNERILSAAVPLVFTTPGNILTAD